MLFQNLSEEVVFIKEPTTNEQFYSKINIQNLPSKTYFY
jgi:hypothetical protein